MGKQSEKWLLRSQKASQHRSLLCSLGSQHIQSPLQPLPPAALQQSQEEIPTPEEYES